MNYAFVHEGKAVGPSGVIRDVQGAPLLAEDVDNYNRLVEQEELKRLREGPERIFCYLQNPKGDTPEELFLGAYLTTWLGTKISQGVVAVGKRRRMGFGGAYRRAVSTRIFGYLYHGWFFESSGQYVRLKRSQKGGGNAVRSDT